MFWLNDDDMAEESRRGRVIERRDSLGGALTPVTGKQRLDAMMTLIMTMMTVMVTMMTVMGNMLLVTLLLEEQVGRGKADDTD